MRNLIVFALSAFAVVSCGSTYEGSNNSSLIEPNSGSVSRVVTENATNVCVPIGFCVMNETQKTIAVRATGNGNWTTVVDVKLYDESGAFCQLSFSENGTKNCSIQTKNLVVADAVITVTPNIVSGVKIELLNE